MERKAGKKNLKLLHEYESSLISLKTQVKEFKRTIEVLENQVCAKTEEVAKLENEVLRARAENIETNHKLKEHQAINGSSKLSELLKIQRSANIKLGLGYENGESFKVAPPEPSQFVKQSTVPLKAMKL